MQCPEVQIVSRVTLIGMFINIFLSAAKFVAGFLFGSQALIADGVHSTSDLVTDIAVLAGVKYWSQPPDPEHPYGHARIETMVTAFIGLLLALAGIEIGWQAVHTWIDGTHAEDARHDITFLVALVSIVSKEWLYRWTKRIALEIKSPAMAANAWHHRSDALSSIPVACAILITMVFPKLWWVDQFGALIVSLFIVYAAWEIMHPALMELSDYGAPLAIAKDIEEEALSEDGVLSVHHVRTRTYGSRIYVDLHIRVDGSIPVRQGHTIAHHVRSRLVKAKLNIADVIVHVEPQPDDEPAKRP